jgi:hypothetical protein
VVFPARVFHVKSRVSCGLIPLLVVVYSPSFITHTEFHDGFHEHRSRAHLRMVVGVSSPDTCSTDKERYALVASKLWTLASASIIGTQIIYHDMSLISLLLWPELQLEKGGLVLHLVMLPRGIPMWSTHPSTIVCSTFMQSILHVRICHRLDGEP